MQRGVILTILLETANPLFFGRMFFQPGVGRGNNQQATVVNALVNAVKEAPWAVKPINEVGRQNKVVARVLRFQVTGIALVEAYPI